MAFVFGASIQGPVKMGRGVDATTLYKKLPLVTIGGLSMRSAMGSWLRLVNRNPNAPDLLTPQVFVLLIDDADMEMESATGKGDGPTVGINGCVLARFGV